MATKELRCDYCNELITEPKEGVLEFIAERDKVSDEMRCREFKIVHQAGASPLNSGGFGGQFCYHHNKEKGFRDLGLHHIINGVIITVLTEICPYEIEQGDEALIKIIERLMPFE